MRGNRPIYVHFADDKLKEAFARLEKEDPTLYKFLNQAIGNLNRSIMWYSHTEKTYT
jgi:translation elongation factor EF-G